MIRGVIKGLGSLQKVFQIKRSVGALKLGMSGCQFSSSIQSLNQVTGFFFCPAKFLSPSNAEHLDIYSSETFVREQEGICNKLPMNLKDIKMPVVC